MSAIPPLDTCIEAHARLAADPGLFQLVVRHDEVTAFRRTLPEGFKEQDEVTPRDGYTDYGTRFVNSYFLRVLKEAADGGWDWLSTLEQQYALSRGVPYPWLRWVR